MKIQTETLPLKAPIDNSKIGTYSEHGRAILPPPRTAISPMEAYRIAVSLAMTSNAPEVLSAAAGGLFRQLRQLSPERSWLRHGMSTGPVLIGSTSGDSAAR